MKRVFLFWNAAFAIAIMDFTSPVHLAPFLITLPNLLQCFIFSVCFSSITIWIADGFLQIVITLVSPIFIDNPEHLLPPVSPPITFRCTLHTSQTHIAPLTVPSPFSQSTNHITLYPPHISDPHYPLNSQFTLQSVHQSHFAVPSTHLRPSLPPYQPLLTYCHSVHLTVLCPHKVTAF